MNAPEPRASAGPITDEQVSRLAQAARDVETPPPPTPVPTDGFFWRSLDRWGKWAAVGAAALALLAFLVGVIGGPDWAGASILYLPVSVLLVLYVPYLLRHRQQERAATYLMRQQSLEAARLEVARLVLEQSRPQVQPLPPEN